jgi:glycosyltransferase involved in cell wall biosynthesis
LGGTLEMYWHHRFWPIYETGVDLFIAPSQFMKKTCVAFGVPAAKIKFLNNFYTNKISPPENLGGKREGNYLLYFGRLAPEKGVHLIVAALKNSSENLKIAGEGPEELNLKNLVKKLGLKKQVEFLGFKSGQDLSKLISRAKAVIIPSVWLENMPLNLLEALAYGKIVVAAEIGGIPEIIKNGENGWLFKPGDIADLREKIKQLKTTETVKMKIAAQATVKKLDPKTHSQKMVTIYQDLINKNKNARK